MLGIEIDAFGHRESFVTHLIRENIGRERRANEKERERRREEREELIRERPSEIMYTSKMMATVHAMDSRKKKKAEGGVSLSGAPIRRDRGYIPGGRSDLDAHESGIRKAHDRAIISMISM